MKKKQKYGWTDLKKPLKLSYPIDVRAALARSGEIQRRYAALFAAEQK